MKAIRLGQILFAAHLAETIFRHWQEVSKSEGVYIIPHSDATSEEIQEELEEMVETYSSSVN